MDIESHGTIGRAFLAIAEANPDLVVYSQAQLVVAGGDPLKEPPRAWKHTTYRECRAHVARLTRYLRTLGLVRGDRVAIFSGTRPEWMEADLAVLCAGGISVSVYPSLTAHEAGYILYDSGAEVVFAENEEQVAKLLTLVGAPFAIPGTEERPAGEVAISLKKIITFEKTTSHPLVVHIDELGPDDGRDPFTRVDEMKSSDIAALVYTSGTTGAPKGVVQTHANHLANVRQARSSGLYHESSILMLILPLAHSFAKLMGYIGFLTPASIRFAAVPDRQSSKFDPRSISKDLSEGGSEIIPVVPRLLEKMNLGIIEKSKGGGARGFLLATTLRAAISIYDAKRNGRQVSSMTTMLALLTGGVRRSIRKKLFGERFKYAISGGAKLPTEVAYFFDALGIEILEGYGLTETCVATNVNRYGDKRIGSVGPVLDRDIEVQIAGDGEILFRGPNVAKGYYQRPTATAQAWDAQGWFHTGDLGRLDNEGFLWIEGRKKELIVTAGGKKIPPEPHEQRIKACEFVAQAMLVGEGKPYCAALVVINEGLVRQWGSSQGLAFDEPLYTDPQVHALVWRHVEQVNRDLATYETIKRIALLPDDFTQDNGLLTPTFKMRRKEVEKRYREEIESLFR